MRKYHFLIALFVVALDRVTKWTIAHRLSMHDSITVIPGFFRIIHAENPGAAFGIFADSPSQWKVGLLISFSIVALVIVFALLWKKQSQPDLHGSWAVIDSGRRGRQFVGPSG